MSHSIRSALQVGFVVLFLIFSMQGCSGITAGNPIDKNEEGNPQNGTLPSGAIVVLSDYVGLADFNLCIEEIVFSGEEEPFSFLYSRWVDLDSNGTILFRLSEGVLRFSNATVKVGPSSCDKEASVQIENETGFYSAADELITELPVTWQFDESLGRVKAVLELSDLVDRLSGVTRIDDLPCAFSTLPEHCESI